MFSLAAKQMMVRKKPTARKSTGGKAPRKRLSVEVSKPRRRRHGLVTSSDAAGQPPPQQAEMDHIDEIHSWLRHAVNAEEAKEQIGLSDEALTEKYILDSANLVFIATLVRARLEKMRSEIEEKTKKVEQLEAQLVTERTKNEEIRSAERDKAVSSFKSSMEFEGLQFEQFCSGYMLCRDEIKKKNPDWDLAFLAEDTAPNDGKKGGASY